MYVMQYYRWILQIHELHIYYLQRIVKEKFKKFEIVR